ncbi:MAG: TRAP transporter substrate-binding protein [Oscillatoria sp. PMC 1051.18]|nr:TRAP transporter substrate-binding protein [Oscillatoria sp. PMC 1050.18]MEC5032146.1 TRAP transporter substrate-binding protein [Oscillatoria sp. PMC 1051.18]
MKRRQFVTNSAIAATSTVAIAACNQNTTTTTTGSLPRIDWRMATSWPQSLDTIFGGAETVCQRVSEMTDGRFTIAPFAAGEIVGGLEVLDAVQSGAVECGHTASYYYVGKNPALGFGTAVPFGFTPQQQNAWLYHGGGLEAMRKIYSDFQIINFPAGNTGTQMGGWFKRQINSISDLNGLKMRIPGLGGQVMSRLGVNVQVLPGGEIFLALDRGAIDAAEWVGPYDDLKLGLNEAANFYYYPGWWEPGATLEVQVNQSAWERLPQEYRQVLETATYEANLNMLSKYDALNGEALQKILAGGTQLTAYPQDVLAAAQRESFALYEENASQDASFREVYEQWQNFRQQVSEWNSLNQLTFENFVVQNSV